MRRIVLVNTTGFPHKGGVENSLKYLAHEYTCMNFTVSTFISNRGVSERMLNHIYYCTLDRFRLPVLIIVIEGISVLLAGLVNRKKLRPATLICRHYLPGYFLGCLYGFENHIYIIPGLVRHQEKLESKDSLITRVHNAVLIKLQERYIAKVGEVVVFSDLMRDSLLSLPHSRVSTKIFPGIDRDKFIYSEKAYNSKGKIKFLFVGRLVGSKGIEYAIDLIALMPLNCTLTVVGDGPLKNDLVNKVNSIPSLFNRVKFVGDTSSPQHYFSSHHCYLMTSKYESFGQTILEALSSYCPVIYLSSAYFGVQTAANELLGPIGAGIRLNSIDRDGAYRALDSLTRYYMNLDKNRAEIDTYLSGFIWSNFARSILHVKK